MSAGIIENYPHEIKPPTGIAMQQMLIFIREKSSDPSELSHFRTAHLVFRHEFGKCFRIAVLPNSFHLCKHKSSIGVSHNDINFSKLVSHVAKQHCETVVFQKLACDILAKFSGF